MMNRNKTSPQQSDAIENSADKTTPPTSTLTTTTTTGIRFNKPKDLIATTIVTPLSTNNINNTNNSSPSSFSSTSLTLPSINNPATANNRQSGNLLTAGSIGGGVGGAIAGMQQQQQQPSPNLIGGSFSSSFGKLVKPNGLQNKLNDVKALLDSENNSGASSSSSTPSLLLTPKFTLDTPQINPRPSILTPLNQVPNNTPSLNNNNNANQGPTPPLTTPRIGKERLKPFEFRFESGRVDAHSASTTPLFTAIDRFSSSASSSGEMGSNGLNLPISSSRSSSASSVSLSSSTSSPAPRLEAANSEKFRTILANADYLNINNKRIKTSMDDLAPICELGSGTCGHVVKMKHIPTGYVMAVKQMSISGIIEENKRILMDLDVLLKSNDCNDIVKCLGYLISASDVWICMELMTMCFDKLLKQIKTPIPECVLGKLVVSTLNALNYLKEQHNIIHRDVKPSNILIDARTGEIKLCDFGISGNLVNSNAFSRTNTGCAGYMAPERIEPLDPLNPSYDIRADVWSLGITLVELATGEYPYRHCRNEFEVMSTIMRHEAPQLSADDERFSPEFKSFVNRCLTKNVLDRPKYSALIDDAFVVAYKDRSVDVKGWYARSVVAASSSSSSASLMSSSSSLIENNNNNMNNNSGMSLSNEATLTVTTTSGDEDGRSTRSLTPTIQTSQTTPSQTINTAHS